MRGISRERITVSHFPEEPFISRCEAPQRMMCGAKVGQTGSLPDFPERPHQGVKANSQFALPSRLASFFAGSRALQGVATRYERLLRKMCDSYTLAWNPLHRLIGLFELSRVWNKRTIYGCVVQVRSAWNVSDHFAYAICNMKYCIWHMRNFFLTAQTGSRPARLFLLRGVSRRSGLLHLAAGGFPGVKAAEQGAHVFEPLLLQ